MTTAYLLLKDLHIACVATSFAGFVWRGVLMLRASPLLQARWVRIGPHIVDTLLLGSAVGLAVVSSQYPLVHPWLTVKVVALVVYIVLGAIALRRGPTRVVRLIAWLAAMAVFLYIVSVAVSRNPLGFFATT